MEKTIISAVVVDEQRIWTKEEICEYLNIPQTLFQEMEEQGFLPSREQKFNQLTIQRIEVACRLHGDLGVNLAGVALALELMDELEILRHRLAVLER